MISFPSKSCDEKDEKQAVHLLSLLVCCLPDEIDLLRVFPKSRMIAFRMTVR